MNCEKCLGTGHHIWSKDDSRLFVTHCLSCYGTGSQLPAVQDKFKDRDVLAKRVMELENQLRQYEKVEEEQ